MDEWIEFQDEWYRLLPIVSSSFMQKNMIRETKEFAACDQKFKKNMKQVRDNPKLIKYAEDYKTKFWFNFFRSSNKVFQEIHKALDELLDKKRESFKRFYFLSNDELLQILSQVKTPQQVIPYLPKVFENIYNLEFDLKDSVMGIVSREGEICKLRGCYLRGEEVEEWMRILEEQMQ
jgi:dynein heavy chain, axonemal